MSVSSSPTTTLAQHELAFETANRCRLLRAALKRSLAGMGSGSARQRVADFVAFPPPDFEGMSLLDLLQAIPRVGPGTAERYLRRAHIMRGKPTIRDLTDRQRGVLVAALREPRRRD